MPFNLISFDQKMSENGVSLFVVADPVDGFPNDGAKINFQFPPIITSESKSINWHKSAKTFVWESLYLWAGAEPRKITLDATYVVGGPSTNNIEWTAAKVAEELRRYKSYFYDRGIGRPATGGGGNFEGTRERGSGDSIKSDLPVFTLIMYQHNLISPSNSSPTTWRGLNVSFKFSDSYIYYDGETSSASSVDVSKTFPLRSSVSLTLELVSNIQVEDDRFFAHVGLPPHPIQQWY